MKITIINTERNEKRYTREELEAFVAQLSDGTYRQQYVRDYTKEVCFAAEWMKQGGELKTKSLNSLVLLSLENLRDLATVEAYKQQATQQPYTLLCFLGHDGHSLHIVCPYTVSDTTNGPLDQRSLATEGTQECSMVNELEFDLTLARGLNYYTGAIFEVKALDVPMGSILGGGRYDNLTGIFGMPGISGVGISFGIDRIFDVLNALDAYPKDAVVGTQLLFINFGERETAYCLPYVAQARAAGIRTEIFPDAAKMKKQMSYANAKQIPFVALAGENEMVAGKLTLKNMETGEQTLVTPDELIAAVK